VSLIAQTFKNLEQKGRRALVGFVTAGDPDIEKSLAVMEAMIEGGCDILEVGIPFSDPTADGPVIQASSQRALAGGMNLTKALGMVKALRQHHSAPIVLFSYYNPILAYGAERFYRDALAAGANGLLVVDLPFEEAGELTGKWPGKDLDLILLVAPTTPRERMEQIALNASGFIYLVSMTGVTGSAGLDLEQVTHTANTLKSVTDIPIAVGFGISTPDHVAAVSKVAQGIVVGSAFERIIEKNINATDLPSIIFQYAKTLKATALKP
jgi:tryptophan synthase alpha chain